MAHIAKRGRHVLCHPLAVRIRIGFRKIAIEKFQNAGKAESLFTRRLLSCRLFFLWATAPIRRRIAVEKQILDTRREFFEGRLQIQVIGVGGQLERALEYRRAGAGTQPPVKERAGPVRDDSGRIEIVFGAQAVASWACAVRRIEAERARLELRNGNAAVRASELFREDMLFAADDRDRNEAASKLQRGGDGLLETSRYALFDEEAVHNDFNIVILAFVEARG